MTFWCFYKVKWHLVFQFIVSYFISRILAADIDTKRLALAKEMGADFLIDSTKDDLIQVFMYLNLYQMIGLDLFNLNLVNGME